MYTYTLLHLDKNRHSERFELRHSEVGNILIAFVPPLMFAHWGFDPWAAVNHGRVDWAAGDGKAHYKRLVCVTLPYLVLVYIYTHIVYVYVYIYIYMICIIYIYIYV